MEVLTNEKNGDIVILQTKKNRCYQHRFRVRSMLPTKILHIKLHRLTSALRLTISSITDEFEKFKYKSLRGSPGSFPNFLQNRGEIHVLCPIYTIEHMFAP